MAEGQPPVQGELGILRVGDKLRMARESAGLSIADIANRTRISQRHLDAIERSDFDTLPSRTYVTGFARAYARAVGISEVEIGREVRAELAGGAMSPREIYEAYEPADPARVPSRLLAWSLVALVVLLLGGYAVWRTLALDNVPIASTSVAPVKKAQAAKAAAAVPATPQVPDNAPVVLTGIQEVWIGFDDATGKSINYRTLKAGESLTVPPNYMEEFTLRTARPQMLKVTIGGVDVGQVGPPDTLVKNISLKRADLAARAAVAQNNAVADLPTR
ncbi:MAG: helix-turn-helix domain-containing protein [Sphingopyxis sp.]|nr:helix-turn-helix domain-containing protein [Sphingopyxis sp.]